MKKIAGRWEIFAAQVGIGRVWMCTNKKMWETIKIIISNKEKNVDNESCELFGRKSGWRVIMRASFIV